MSPLPSNDSPFDPPKTENNTAIHTFRIQIGKTFSLCKRMDPVTFYFIIIIFGVGSLLMLSLVSQSPGHFSLFLFGILKFIISFTIDDKEFTFHNNHSHEKITES